MENARELELIEKREKLERTGNRILKGFLIIFFLGYAVFFTSRLWLPTPYEGVAITPIGKSITVEDRTLTIDSWKYSKEQREMEIIVEVIPISGVLLLPQENLIQKQFMKVKI